MTGPSTGGIATINDVRSRGALREPIGIAPVTAPDPLGRPSPSTGPGRGPDFAQELDLAARPIHVSRHAMQRLERRNIDLGPNEMDRLRGAVETLSRRGARDSVVMLDRLALVVNVPSATVLTALEPDGRKEAVFTNIDSVVIA